jgi:CheY-like chemotaxis protein
MLLTGYADFQSALKAINSGHIFRLLTKPCPPDTLADALTSGIEEYIRISKKTGSRDGGKTIRPAKKILVVDDNPVMGDMLTKALKDYDELSVLTSRNGKDAAGLLMNQRIDFVVTELAMPVMNGLKLLRYMKLRHPEIPAAVVTGLDKPDLESRIRALGNYSYFEKPMDINVLLALIFEEMDSGGVSQIHGISIAAFLQLVDTEKKTCTLTVREKNKIGYLYLLEGDLMAAETGHIQGEEAAYQIITWDKTIIEVENVCSKKDREIHLPLMMILMESARLKDEQRSGTLE